MEVFTVSVGIGRVAISVRQTRQVVSRLHEVCCTARFGSQPVIVSVIRLRGLRRLFAALGMCSPAAHICKGPWYLSLPVSPSSRTLIFFQGSEHPRRAPDNLSPYQGTIFKPFGLVGGSVSSTEQDLWHDPISPAFRDGSRRPADGRTPPTQPAYISVVAGRTAGRF
jgi:hypothetical protein